MTFTDERLREIMQADSPEPCLCCTPGSPSEMRAMAAELLQCREAIAQHARELLRDDRIVMEQARQLDDALTMAETARAEARRNR